MGVSRFHLTPLQLMLPVRGEREDSIEERVKYNAFRIAGRRKEFKI